MRPAAGTRGLRWRRRRSRCGSRRRRSPCPWCPRTRPRRPRGSALRRAWRAARPSAPAFLRSADRRALALLVPWRRSSSGGERGP
ncbi:MAG: hypothetical protein CO108_30410 [Deltaproteobacteria bacterium CG_4_9_14_3_um_filter_63_12]|nr:MAG: hypothetical protein CO108_30410 [Deltaproteobacteria bacterium CG_4_9_14_3_um_filter_63_12]